ncbi:MAG: neutral zinc metallopeptidase [Lewinella sp.]|nr:neutral zinc metallopeptidase [Lewinella sp.]
MRWQGRERSSNVEDRRGGRSGGSTTRKVGGSLGIGTILVVIIALFLGKDPSALLQMVAGGQSAPQSTGTTTTGNAAEDELAEFVSVVLKDTEDVWSDLFPRYFGRNYQAPTLVLYSEMDQSACGMASAATGPFYCPADQKVYIDLSFYQELKDRFRAPGDFAMAYIVAHEVAHHVQNLLGYTRQVSGLRGKVSETRYNDASKRLELQADFLAGVWAHHAQRTKNILEEGDIEEALNAANAVGDDRIQMEARGYVVPDSFTHGTSDQRMRWFTKGFQTGDVNQGDTFSADPL